MAGRGRPPKPTHLKLLQGNAGKRRQPEGEPKPPLETPSCPAWLSKVAKTEWKRIVPELEELQLLTRCDRAALAAYCESYSSWQAAEKWLRKNGPQYIVRDKDGQIKYVAQFPMVAVANKSKSDMRAFLTEFGLSPASRTRIKGAAAPPGKKKGFHASRRRSK